MTTNLFVIIICGYIVQSFLLYNIVINNKVPNKLQKILFVFIIYSMLFFVLLHFAIENTYYILILLFYITSSIVVWKNREKNMILFSVISTVFIVIIGLLVFIVKDFYLVVSGLLAIASVRAFGVAVFYVIKKYYHL